MKGRIPLDLEPMLRSAAIAGRSAKAAAWAALGNCTGFLIAALAPSLGLSSWGLGLSMGAAFAAVSVLRSPYQTDVARHLAEVLGDIQRMERDGTITPAELQKLRERLLDLPGYPRDIASDVKEGDPQKKRKVAQRRKPTSSDSSSRDVDA